MSIAQGAHQDGVNQVFSIIGVQGTLGTADTSGTAQTLPIGVNPANGAMYVAEIEPDPLVQVNPSLILSYDIIGNLTTLTKNIGSDQYAKTLSYDGVGNLTNVSVWTKL